MFKKENLYRIYSNCRRGMLELDVILINFLEKEYLNLDNKLLSEFSELLNESDNNLQNWIVKEIKYTEKKFDEIIKKIKESKYKMSKKNIKY
ncbi:MAG TPA: FAD assembly factor SdhE [Candidatus Azoamicus sp. MARI]